MKLCVPKCLELANIIAHACLKFKRFQLGQISLVNCETAEVKFDEKLQKTNHQEQ